MEVPRASSTGQLALSGGLGCFFWSQPRHVAGNPKRWARSKIDRTFHFSLRWVGRRQRQRAAIGTWLSNPCSRCTNGNAFFLAAPNLAPVFPLHAPLSGGRAALGLCSYAMAPHPRNQQVALAGQTKGPVRERYEPRSPVLAAEQRAVVAPAHPVCPLHLPVCRPASVTESRYGRRSPAVSG